MPSNISSVNVNHRIPKWICQIATAYGYWPSDIYTNYELRSSRIRLNIRIFAWPVIALLLYAFCMYVQFISLPLYQLLAYSKLEIMIDTFTNITYALTSILTVSTSLWNRKTIAKFIQIMHKVDHEVSNYVCRKSQAFRLIDRYSSSFVKFEFSCTIETKTSILCCGLYSV